VKEFTISNANDVTVQVISFGGVRHASTHPLCISMRASRCGVAPSSPTMLAVTRPLCSNELFVCRGFCCCCCCCCCCFATNRCDHEPSLCVHPLHLSLFHFRVHGIPPSLPVFAARHGSASHLFGRRTPKERWPTLRLGTASWRIGRQTPPTLQRSSVGEPSYPRPTLPIR
jgi:hypothetical protein